MDVFKQELAYSIGMEPVTLAEAKAHILVDFSTDDTLIQNLITQCRGSVENFCHVSITPKNITWTFSTAPVEVPIGISKWDLAFYGFTGCGEWRKMPYGPIGTITSVSNVADNGTITPLTLNTDYFVRGSLFKEIKINSYFGSIVVVYSTGWPYNSTAGEAVPGALKLAILNELAFRYEQRGNSLNRYASQETGISEGAQALAKDYIQIWL